VTDRLLEPHDTVAMTVLHDPSEHSYPPEHVLIVAVRGPVVCLDICKYEETAKQMAMTDKIGITVSASALIHAVEAGMRKLSVATRVEVETQFPAAANPPAPVPEGQQK
jgi:hypothetical protein